MDVRYLGKAGSGTVLAGDDKTAVVLTCKHVCSRAPTADEVRRLKPAQMAIVVKFPSGIARWASFIGVDDQADLAALLITADAQTPRVAWLAQSPAQGATVYQIGYPHGLGPRPQQGVVRPSLGAHFVASMRLIPGDSGSGLFTPDGRLCGVAWGGMAEAPGAPTLEAQAASAQAIDRFLTHTCLPWLPNRRPPSRPPAPVTPGVPGESVPALPPTPLYPPAVDLQPLTAAVADLQKQVAILQQAIQNQPRPRDGKDGVDGKPGRDGKDGEPGLPGKDALPGTPLPPKPNVRVRVVPAKP